MDTSDKQPKPILSKDEWTEPEKWVWEKICKGEIADFNAEFQRDLNPQENDSWAEARLINSYFLETILLSEPYRSSVHRKGVRIVGAWINEKLDLSNGDLIAELWIDKSRFEEEVNLYALQTNCSISFELSVFNQTLNLLYANVGGQLNLSKTKVSGKLNMNSLSVRDLPMSEAVLEEVDLAYAKVGGLLDLNGVKVSGKLDMNSLSVRNLIMSEAVFEEVDLVGAKIGGYLNLNGAKVSGKVNMNSLSVSESIYIMYGEFNGAVHLTYATVNDNIHISSSKFSELDLGSTNIRGELQFGYSMNWDKDAFLNLRNTQVGSLQDNDEYSWPSLIDLDGFTCSRLGGSWHDPFNKSIVDREAEWFTKWLAKDKSYSPQPYHHIATLLTVMGHSEKSNEIIYAAKSREKDEAFKDKLWSKWMGLSILDWTIGYGIGAKYFKSLVWVFAFTAIGVWVLNTVTTMKPEAIWYKIGFSLDMLLPIIELNDQHKLNFGGWQLYYFYFHKLMGFLLGSFVVAGLSGITKR